MNKWLVELAGFEKCICINRALWAKNPGENPPRVPKDSVLSLVWS